MDFKKDYKAVLGAALEFKNLILLSLIIGVFLYTSNILFFLLGLAGYVYFLMQTMKEESFIEKLGKEQQIRNIYNLNQKSNILCKSVLRCLPGGMKEKIKNIHNQKEAVMIHFAQDSNDSLRQRMTINVLNLVMAYFKLNLNFNSIRIQLNSTNINRVIDRINNNKRKLNFTSNPTAIANMQRAIELDERLVEKIGTERSSLETISSRIDYIESAIHTFRHQITSNNDPNSMLADIDDLVNEAMALDKVLSSRNERLKL